jgi:hypothetical protein
MILKRADLQIGKSFMGVGYGDDAGGTHHIAELYKRAQWMT